MKVVIDVTLTDVGKTQNPEDIADAIMELLCAEEALDDIVESYDGAEVLRED